MDITQRDHPPTSPRASCHAMLPSCLSVVTMRSMREATSAETVRSVQNSALLLCRVCYHSLQSWPQRGMHWGQEEEKEEGCEQSLKGEECWHVVAPTAIGVTGLGGGHFSQRAAPSGLRGLALLEGVSFRGG